ncbi:MAG: bifunctional DNA-binding transcriptional regulator/O6-methylguanine-DNA methyltransferase Ada [Betaproteobacteria bacterium]|nr:bifunctional DNA-binding transcriptional regulator/O6-methylguanine-DNA methyltransferase Ada [Betaproteobacteria bacterium]
MKALTQREQRLRSVMARDARADGAFVYAVRTTGIYCRPSCPSRRPRPESVEFFAAPAAAERAGYRPCKRCTPQQADRQRAAVLAACRHIDTHSDQRLTLRTLGRKVGLSPHHLQRLFKQIIGVSPREYQEARRLAQFKHGVRNGRAVTTAMLDAGFGSSSRLYEKSARHLGMTPARYRKQGAGLAIAFTTFATPLGKVLLAATPQGICKVSLDASASRLEAELRAEFGAAAITRDDRKLEPYAKTIAGYLGGSHAGLDLPLDIRATAFQRKVWNILKSIPRGATRSYSDIARRAREPSAVRAVATAIASNPVALLIPCHRAVRKNGDLAGYRWGIERKAALLAQEKKPTKTRA